MKRIRALVAVIMITYGLLWGGTDVLAANTANLEILSGDTIIRKGEEIELLFSLDGYDEIQDGVNALKGTLAYDSDVFVEVAQNDFELLNAWENLYYNPQNGQFVLMKRGGSTNEEAVFSLKLTAGQSLPAREISVAVTDISLSEGKTDLFPDDVSVKLKAVSEQSKETSGKNPNDPEQSIVGLGGKTAYERF